MKLFHLSDLHLGKIVNGVSILEDQRFILQQILDWAKKRSRKVYNIDLPLKSHFFYNRLE